MLSILRKITDFQERTERRFKEKLDKVQDNEKQEVLEVKKVEDEREELSRQYEEEVKQLEMKYEKRMSEVLLKRRSLLYNSTLFTDFWLRVLGNHKIVKDFITEEDRAALKHLVDIRTEKLNDGLSFKMLFEFSQNEFFENSILEKHYFLNKEMLIEKIESSNIIWKEGKSLAHKKVSKTLKNKKTGEKKTVEIVDEKDSFFNFFSNVRLPTTEEIKNIDFELEKDLGQHFDTEYEFAMEFAEDIIPHALEYFMGIKHDSEEYIEYINEQVVENSEMNKGKDKKKKKKKNKGNTFFSF